MHRLALPWLVLSISACTPAWSEKVDDGEVPDGDAVMDDPSDDTGITGEPDPDTDGDTDGDADTDADGGPVDRDEDADGGPPPDDGSTDRDEDADGGPPDGGPPDGGPPDGGPPDGGPPDGGPPDGGPPDDGSSGDDGGGPSDDADEGPADETGDDGDGGPPDDDEPECEDLDALGAEDLGDATGESIASGTTDDMTDFYESDCARPEEDGVDQLFTWKSPRDGCYRFTTEGSSYDTILSFHTACDLVEFDCDDDGGPYPSSVLVRAFDRDDDLVIGLDSWSYDDESGEYLLTIEMLSTDLVIDDILGSGTGEYVVLGSTIDASDDYAGACSETGGPDKAYEWTAPTTGCWEFSTLYSGFDTVLRLYEPDGETCAGSGELDCDDDGAAGRTSALQTELAEGESIVVVVDGYDAGDSGLFALHVFECESTDEPDAEGGS